MTYVPLAKNTSKRLSGLVPDLPLVNMYAEATESNGVSGYDLLTRPALKTLMADPSAQAGNGVFHLPAQQNNFGSLFTAQGIAFRNINPVTGAFTNVGALSGILPPQVAYGDGFMFIASGGLLQVYDSTDGLQTITLPDNQSAQGVVYLNGYVIVLPFGSKYLYYSDPTKLPTDAEYFDGGRRVGALLTPGEVQRIEVRGEELHVFLEDGYELFMPTGLDDATDPPFARVDGRNSSIGVAAPYSVVQLSDLILYVGDDCHVYRMDTMQPITRPSDVERIRTAVEAGYLITAWPLDWSGHSFYVLNLGTTTLAFDITTGIVAEWRTGTAGWRAAHGVRVSPSQIVAQDGLTGSLYNVTDAQGADDGDATMTQRGTGLMPLSQRSILSSVSLDCAVGVSAASGNAASVELFTSRDQGRTYLSHGVEPLSGTGGYMQRMRWRRLGQANPPMLMIAFESDTLQRSRFSNMRANDPF